MLKFTAMWRKMLPALATFAVVVVMSASVGVLSGCAGMQSPFTSSDPALHVEGATKSVDAERELGMSFMVIKAMRAGTPQKYVTGFARTIEDLVNSEKGVSNAGLVAGLRSYVDKHAKYPEDRIMANYLISKLNSNMSKDAIKAPKSILSPEQRRITLLYAKVMKDTANTFKP